MPSKRYAPEKVNRKILTIRVRDAQYRWLVEKANNRSVSINYLIEMLIDTVRKKNVSLVFIDRKLDKDDSHDDEL